MRNTLLAIALVALAAQARADSDGSTPWSKLWRNADQRGEAMLKQGNASGAAKAYADPRRKGYALFKAGDYGAAAHELSAVDDSEAHYNRGNALAYAGDLPGALQAYDAALKRDPNSLDARHNRDLVAKALEKKKQQDADKKKSQDGKKDNKKDNKKDDKQSGKKGSQAADNPGEKPALPQGAGQDGKPDSKPGDKPGTKGQSPSAAQSPVQAASADRPSTAGQSKPGAPPPPDTANTPGPSDAEQARRDVNASMKASQATQAGGAGPDKAGRGREAPTGSIPMTENQIAQEQWLRSIPDDPGGLLRRKFLIEHMMRQRNSQP